MKNDHTSDWWISGVALTAGFLLGRALVRSTRKFHIQNKVALVTGGSRGLGLILARKLADQGARIAICARDEETLKKAADDLSYRTSHIVSIVCDITNHDQVKNTVKEVQEKLGDIDILINNAGEIQLGPMENMADSDYKQAMDLFFWGPYHFIQEIYPAMIKKKAGRIVNIVSIGGKVSFPHLLPYNTGKFAFSGFSEGITAEMSRYNVKVTTVYPGLMRTGSPRHITVKNQNEKEYAWFKIADSLPIISTNAEKAAQKILKAMIYGRKTLTLTIPAKLGKVLHEVAPDFTITLFDIINRLLPDSESSQSTEGKDSESALSSNMATKLTEKAEEKHNQ